VNATLPLPSESSLLRVAQSCCQATKVLTAVPDSFTLIPLAMIVSHGLEATLKCHLLQKGKSLEFCIGIGHDLLKAWDAAAREGAPIEGPPPTWLLAFQWGHAKPYAFRYLPDMYGVGVPRADEFVPWWDKVLKELYRRSGRL
jgi:hypothetical protein